MTYDFKYKIGEDFAKTLPIFFSDRFDKVEVIAESSQYERFDYVFVPDISLSRLSVNLFDATATQPTPTYNLEISLKLVTKKNSTQLESTTIKESITKQTEVDCWTCFGEKILDQQQIRNEYSALLTTVYRKLDTYLEKLMESQK